MPFQLHRVLRHCANASIPSASTAFRMALNTGRSAFFGEKYALHKVRQAGVNVCKEVLTRCARRCLRTTE
jgi:hypothetical protein